MWLAALRARVLSDADRQSHTWFFLFPLNEIQSRYIISSSKGIVKMFTAILATHVVATRHTRNVDTTTRTWNRGTKHFPDTKYFIRQGSYHTNFSFTQAMHLFTFLHKTNSTLIIVISIVFLLH
jgi:hypothetical protein